MHPAAETPLGAAGEVVPAGFGAGLALQLHGFFAALVGGEPQGPSVALAQAQGATAGTAVVAHGGELHKAVGGGLAGGLEPVCPSLG
jgi:hypothetical protein